MGLACVFSGMTTWHLIANWCDPNYPNDNLLPSIAVVQNIHIQICDKQYR